MTVEQIVLHDSRLAGRVFRRPGIHLIETHCETNEQIARRIRAAVRPNRASPGQMNTQMRFEPVPILSILAHGSDVATGPIDWVIQIGVDYIHRDNARAFGASIRHCVSDRIRVMCCNAARTEDARMACRELAAGAAVPVYASTTVQDYSEVNTRGQYTIQQVTGQQQWGWIQFGNWEGTVMRFPPTGEPGTVVFEGPAPQARPPATDGGGGADICG